MPKATIADLYRVVDWRLEHPDTLVYDLLADTGQMLDNVRHMRWFRNAIAQALIDNVKRYAHLSLD